MKPFLNSTALMTDAVSLKRRLERDGYLFFKKVVDSPLVDSLRRQIVVEMQRENWLEPGAELDEVASATVPYVEGEEGYFSVYDRVQKLEAFHRLAHEDCVLSVMKLVLGDTAFPHPLSIARLVLPGNTEGATPPHQDYPNNQGSKGLTACWIPLGDCPTELGGLSVLAGSHKLGLLPVAFSVGAGNRQAVLDARHDSLNWVGGDFESGDMLVFHSLTVHRSLPNITNHMRISVDYRFQCEGEPLTENCLLPHFQRLSWEDIYAGWSRRDLAYYWKGKDYTVQEWNTALHDIPPQSVDAAIREKIIYDHRRLGKKPSTGDGQ